MTWLERLIDGAERMARFHHDTCDSVLVDEFRWFSKPAYPCNCGKADIDAALSQRLQNGEAQTAGVDQ